MKTYVLTKTLDGATTIVAVSGSKNILREKLIRDAKRIVRKYYDADDEFSRKRKTELFRSLNNICDATHWDDGEENYLLSFDIEEVPLLTA